MTCNRCHKPLLPDHPVQPSFSGRYPYVHADPAHCPALRADARVSGSRAPLRLVRDIEPDG